VISVERIAGVVAVVATHVRGVDSANAGIARRNSRHNSPRLPALTTWKDLIFMNCLCWD
jgi:hypothetical protein